MNFLAPAFLAGLAAIAVPVIIHLINRERKVVVEFPSLMFLQRIPYRSVRRQKIRHLLLLMLRCLALALLVAAFARPFFERRQTRDCRARRARAGDSARPLVRAWATRIAGRRRKDAAKKAVSRTRPTDHATLVLFASDAAVASEPMATPDRIDAAINAAKLSAEATRYAPALKLASQIVTASTLPRREVVLISDYQKIGWANHNEIVFPAGHVDHAGRSRRRRAVGHRRRAGHDGPRQHRRSRPGHRRRPAHQHRRAAPRTSRRRSPSADATCRRRRVTVAAARRAASGVHVRSRCRAARRKARVRITPDSLTQNDVINFTIAPDEAVPVLIVEPASPRQNQSLFLSRALAIGDRPSFRVDGERRE